MRFCWTRNEEQKEKRGTGETKGEKKKATHFLSLSLFSHLTQPESTPLPTMGSSGSNPFENFRAS
jgi:hypothetical protein